MNGSHLKKSLLNSYVQAIYTQSFAMSGEFRMGASSFLESTIITTPSL